MTLADRVQARAERIHVDTVRITDTPAHPDDLEFNPASLELEEPEPTVIYDGPGLVTIGDLDATTDSPGARNRHVDDYKGSINASATVVRVGQTLTVTASEWDPTLVGATFRINVVVNQTYRSRLRLGLQRLNEGPRL